MKLFQAWSHNSQLQGELIEAAEAKPLRIEVLSTPAVNDVLWYLIFACVFYGGGILLGGFAFFLGEFADFSQKSNRRVFLLLVLANFLPVLAARIYRQVGRKTYVFEIDQEGKVSLNGKDLPIKGMELIETEDVHGNDIAAILLYSTKFREPLLLYQSKDANYIQKLYAALPLQAVSPANERIENA